MLSIPLTEVMAKAEEKLGGMKASGVSGSFRVC